MAKPLGILGGTFDPVHNGHLHLARECHRILELEQVRLIPVNIPPHRKKPLASPAHRLVMLELAIENQKQLAVDDRELLRNEVSYTIETLKSLRSEIGAQPLCVIVGMDAFQKLNTWHQWHMIPDYAHLVVADRPGSLGSIKQSEVKKLCNERLVDDLSSLHNVSAGCILKVDVPMLDISATRIRQLIAAEAGVSDLLPKAVIDYIEKNKLYKEKE